MNRTNTRNLWLPLLASIVLACGKPAAPPPAAAPVQALERIRADGRFFVTSRGTFRPVFASALAILTKPAEQQAAVLAERQSLGFNGIRVFAGALPWAGQTPDAAAAALPALLEEAARRGLYVYVSAITDSGTGYDVEAHLRRIAAIVASHDNALLEVANEIGHPTQSERVNDPAALLALARRIVPADVPWALGAALGVDDVSPDHPYPTAGGVFNDAHLDRGGDRWTQVAGLRGIAGIGEATGKPVISGEPIGAAEAAIVGRRASDPAFFFAMGALCRGFELGCVWHSEAGLHAEPLGPMQRRAAEAFITGWRALDTDARLSFESPGPEAPIAAVDAAHVAHAYAFVAGARGFLVLLGVSGEPALRFTNGWSDGGVAAEQPGVQVRRIDRR